MPVMAARGIALAVCPSETCEVGEGPLVSFELFDGQDDEDRDSLHRQKRPPRDPREGR